jgi:CheY-like chemotaxis protein
MEAESDFGEQAMSSEIPCIGQKLVSEKDQSEQSSHGKQTVLVAEDTDSNYALVYILLRKEYHVVRAVNGLEVMRLFDELGPDFIFMDIQMPELNGLDATRMIRKKDGKVPIVALTAFAFDTDKQAFMEAGGTEYIVKPLDPDKLRATVKRLIQEA